MAHFVKHRYESISSLPYGRDQSLLHKNNPLPIAFDFHLLMCKSRARRDLTHILPPSNTSFPPIPTVYLVGVRIIAPIWLRLSSVSLRRIISTTGTTNASVLPDPVTASTHTSLFVRNSGIVAAYQPRDKMNGQWTRRGPDEQTGGEDLPPA